MYKANHLLAHLAAEGLTNPGKIFAHRPDTGQEMSYGDLFALAEMLAGHLVANGLRPGDRVAVQVEKSLEALALYLGTVMAGGVYLPLNTAYTPDEVAYFLADAEPRIVVVDPSRLSAISPLAGGARMLTLDARGHGTLAEAAPARFAAVPRGPGDLAAILYTSGTTGRSKGAMLTHDNLLSNSETLRDVWGFTEEDVLIHALPIFHTHGLFVATNVALLAGASLIFLPRFDPDAVLDVMPRSTAMMGVPTFYTRLLRHPGLTREAAANMRLFISGSAPLLPQTHREWEERTGHRILERYGMTETNMNTSNPLEGERRAGTVGLPLPGVELRIVDAEGREVPRGEVGVIEVRGPNVFKGYWRMPEKTAEELRPDGWFVTGDLGTMSDDGYVTIVGRARDLVISGGLNVYPREIEEMIDALPGVVESAVIGVPHPDFGEAVVAVVVGETDEAEVLHGLEGRLARFKQPKRVIVVDELPRNTMGKVQKNVLRDRYANLFA